jgi:hypothetical protein
MNAPQTRSKRADGVLCTKTELAATLTKKSLVDDKNGKA